ncbi:substrate-binding periplasmic protein [Marinobacter zhejiangensis]|nr:transporter substrate-binding domain-containing protein [Marinobacter zhejiangensis]
MRKLLQLILALTIVSSPQGRAETVMLTSLEWPPYSGEELPNQGTAIEVARAAFQAAGHTLLVDFFPWSRTIATVQTSENHIGYLPEYKFDTDVFVMSAPIGISTVGFAERRSAPVHWDNLDDLSMVTVGVVQDYANTPDLDARIAAGSIQVSEAITDSQNLLKLAAGRVDLVVIDPEVLAYLCDHNPRVRAISDQLQMNPKTLATQTLHVAFENTEAGRRWLAIFNEALAGIEIPGAREASPQQ